VETGPQLAAREDDDVAAELLERMREEGVEVHLGANVSRVEGRSGKAVRLHLQTAAADQIVEGSDILVAVGRTPNTAEIGLDRAGVTLDPRGYIAVDDRLATSAPDVWAVGECAGSPRFTHASLDDFRVVHAHLTGGERTTRGRLIPYCTFTDPPLAHIGLHEREARRQGVAFRLAKLPISAVVRSRTLSETHGFMKALVAADSDRILGFTMIGPEASEVVAVVQTAMLAGMPYTGLRDAIIAHPTMAEGLGGLLAKVPGR
jgi:pyruvate/2-oxoglutarate dehydrogenase complex dihydrolipoamide dehydrogenase (E3) component